MNKEKYEELILRFAKELHDIGVSDNMKKIIEAKYERTPNVVSCSHEETTRKFTYMHEGYEIQAMQSVKISVKKCK